MHFSFQLTALNWLTLTANSFELVLNVIYKISVSHEKLVLIKHTKYLIRRIYALLFTMYTKFNEINENLIKKNDFTCNKFYRQINIGILNEILFYMSDIQKLWSIINEKNDL